MVSDDGERALVFNGEIYNHQDIRRELERERGGWPWRGHSDTETLFEAIVQWGMDGALSRCNGMFACAYWSRNERRLWLGRDRLGKKPLYYGFSGDTFLFGSELKCLRAHPDFRGTIDRNVLALFLRHNYIPAPYCIYEGFAKLSPGSILELDGFAGSGRPSVTVRTYWSLEDAVAHGLAQARDAGPGRLGNLEELLRDAVKIRMEADVPLGALLSGGVDSSLVVALMQSQSTRPVRTFSIGFNEAEHDETDQAAAIARHLGTEHSTLYLDGAAALDVIPLLPNIYDEPFADSSQIPTYLVSRLAREQVTVAVSGDGGDELFAGYGRYAGFERQWRALQRIPRPLRKTLGALLSDLPAAGGGGSLRAAASAIARDDARAFYRFKNSYWRNPEGMVPGSREPQSAFFTRGASLPLQNPVELAMFLDTAQYLPDDVLVKVDRASMAASLEMRSPLLDYRVLEAAWRMPLADKLAGGRTKAPLRDILAQYLPETLIQRGKHGFSVPVEEWLRGALRPWAEALLDETRLSREGFLNPVAVRKSWKAFLGGRSNLGSSLWGVLMFQAWQENQV
jgi:asparagine synthase (glutamine-hydrolysing)